MIKALVWDLDGTLLNTIDDLAGSVNFALTKYNLPTKTVSEVKKAVGNGVNKLIERCIQNGQANINFVQILQAFKEHYSQNSAVKTAPYPQINETLKELKTRGFKLAVVSNKFESAVKELCQKYFPNTFDVIIGETPQIKRKPAPDMLFAALKKLQVQAEEIYFIGDSEVDVQTARNAQIKCLSALWGFRDKQTLLTNGATDFLNTPQEIFKFLEK